MSGGGDGRDSPQSAGPGPGTPRPASLELSPREREIVRLVAAGLTDEEIAAALGVSRWTVATHLRRVFVKLRVHRRRDLVARAIQDGLVDGAGGAPGGGAPGGGAPPPPG